MNGIPATLMALSLWTPAQSGVTRTLQADAPLHAGADARGVMVGRLVDTAGEPLQGQAVWGADDAITATADADGRFRFDARPVGARDGVPLRLHAPGFRTVYAKKVSVRDLGHRDLGDVFLVPGGVIEGRVLDPDGRAVAGARVELMADSDQGWWDTVVVLQDMVTDGTGHWRADGVWPMSHVVRVTPPAPLAMTVQRNVRPGQTATVQVAMGRTVTLNLRDWEDRPVVGVPVVLAPRIGSALCRLGGTTDARGCVTLANVPRTECALRPGSDSALPWPPADTLAAEATEWDVRPLAGLLRVQPVDAETGEAISYAIAVFSPKEIREEPTRMPLDRAYRIGPQDVLRVRAPGYHDAFVGGLSLPESGIQRIEVRMTRAPAKADADQAESAGPVSHRSGPRGIRGIVHRARRPVQGAIVRLRDHEVRTDAEGRFVLDVPRGCTGTVRADGGVHGSAFQQHVQGPAVLSLSLDDWSDPPVEWIREARLSRSVRGRIVVPWDPSPSGVLTGTVRINGQRAMAQEITVLARSEVAWWPVGRGWTDEEGAFSFPVSPGEDATGRNLVILEAQPHDWGDEFDVLGGVARRSADLAVGEGWHQDFDLEVAAVTLSLADRDGRPLDFDPRVFPLDEVGDPIRTRGPFLFCGTGSTFDAHQDFPLRLSRGRYRVQFWTWDQGHVLRDFEVEGPGPLAVKGVAGPVHDLEILAPDGVHYVALADERGLPLAAHSHDLGGTLGAYAVRDEGPVQVRFTELQENRYRLTLHGPEQIPSWPESGKPWRQEVVEIEADSPGVVVVDWRDS